MSATKLAQQYILGHPSVRDCIKLGLINYSALSREICKANRIRSFDAVLVACRRQSGKIKNTETQQSRILSLVNDARLKLTNRMLVAIAEKPRDFERVYELQREIRRVRGEFRLIEGGDWITIISEEKFEAEIKEVFKGRLLRLSTGLAQLVLSFDERIEVTPGVVSFVYGRLAENGINVLEEMSCWTDLLLVLAEQDAAKALKVLDLKN